MAIHSIAGVSSDVHQGDLFQYIFLTNTFLSSVVPQIIEIAFAFAVSILLMRRIASRWVNNRSSDQQSGEAVIQFLFVLPLLLCILLVIFQIALLMQAKFVVNYAAFCAVRSAVVVIPEGVQSGVTSKSEAPGEINGDDPTYPKLAEIRRAAGLACVSISPTASAGLALGPGLQGSGLESLPKALTVFGPSQTLRFLNRAPYALSSGVTTVTVEKTQSPAGAGGNFSLVTAHLTYRYFLTVPFADKLFGKPFSGNWLTGAGYYVEIREQYTLPMENDKIFPRDLRAYQQYLTEE